MPTPTHPVRVEPKLWKAALARARREDRTLSEVIREFLQWYVASEENDDDEPEDAA